MRQAIHWLADGSAEILDPALRYALASNGAEQSEVLTEFRGLRGEGIQPYCFDCWQLTGNKYPVTFRGPGFNKSGVQTTCPHFFHEKNHDKKTHGQATKKHGGESIAHSVAKTVVAQIEKGKTNVVDVSKEVPVTERGVNRRPDVVSTCHDGSRHAHEVQYSPIHLEDLRRRTLDLLKAGFDSVSWYLFRRSYTAENRAWLASQDKVFFFYATLKNTDDPNSPEISFSAGKLSECEPQKKRLKELPCKLNQLVDDFAEESHRKPDKLKSAPLVAQTTLAEKPIPVVPPISAPTPLPTKVASTEPQAKAICAAAKAELDRWVGRKGLDSVRPNRIEILRVVSYQHKLVEIVDQGTDDPVFTRPLSSIRLESVV